MKHVFYRISKAPTPLSVETIDLVVISAVFDQKVTVLIESEAVWHLVHTGDTNQPGYRNMLSAFDEFDVDNVWVKADDLRSRNIDARKLPIYVSIVDDTTISNTLRTADAVIPD